jgi:hypothetical protein
VTYMTYMSGGLCLCALPSTDARMEPDERELVPTDHLRSSAFPLSKTRNLVRRILGPKLNVPQKRKIHYVDEQYEKAESCVPRRMA